MKPLSRALALVVMVMTACAVDQAPVERIDINAAAFAPGPSPLRRLTQAQYRNTIRDLVGPEIALPDTLEPDSVVEGLAAVGGSLATVSPLGVERYERAARGVVEQLLADRKRFAQLLPCAPAGSDDAGCMGEFVRAFGKRAWRRPLSDKEATRVTAVGLEAAQRTGDFYAGTGYAVLALLQSPYFLFRVELGANGRLDAWEAASRLSYFLLNSMPDEELFAAAEAGTLTSREGVREQAERLMEKPAARDGLRNFFTELLKLDGLDRMMKDPGVFPAVYPEFGADAREETLRLVTYLAFEKRADFRTYFTTQETFVNRRLAKVYDLPAPAGDEFTRVTVPKANKRRGLLGQASFLALQSHPVSSSAVLRGRFVRQTLLCGEIPPPPAQFNTGTPEPDADSPTLRDRLAAHMTNPACASCHQLMDPIGLGFENFDGIGRYRTLDNGAPIDAAGVLDDARFDDAWGLTEAVAEHPNLGYCLARNLYRYATGRVEEAGEFLFLEYLALAFAQSGYDVRSLFVELASSDAFRAAGVNP